MSLAKRLAESGTGRIDTRFTDLRQRVHQQLIDELGPIISNATPSWTELERIVHDASGRAGQGEGSCRPGRPRRARVGSTDDILGYGPIDPS